MSLPSNANGIDSSWTGVGLTNFSLTMACNNRVSNPRSAKVWQFLFSCGSCAIGVGTPSVFNLRFIITEVTDSNMMIGTSYA